MCRYEHINTFSEMWREIEKKRKRERWRIDVIPHDTICCENSPPQIVLLIYISTLQHQSIEKLITAEKEKKDSKNQPRNEYDF
jgi:hypothetical protein